MLKRFLISCAVALTLSSCAQLQKIGELLDPTAQSIIDGGLSVTAETDNPIGPAEIDKADQAVIVAGATAVSFRRLCRRGALYDGCEAMVQELRKYTPAARIAWNEMRAFALANDQVSAKRAALKLRSILQQIKAAATTGAR